MSAAGSGILTEVSGTAGAATTVRAIGVIDRRVMDRCASDLLDWHPVSVTLDLADVTFLGSSGVRVIADLRQQLRSAGIGFSIVNVPAAYALLMALTA